MVEHLDAHEACRRRRASGQRGRHRRARGRRKGWLWARMMEDALRAQGVLEYLPVDGRGSRSGCRRRSVDMAMILFLVLSRTSLKCSFVLSRCLFEWRSPEPEGSDARLAGSGLQVLSSPSSKAALIWAAFAGPTPRIAGKLSRWCAPLTDRRFPNREMSSWAMVIADLPGMPLPISRASSSCPDKASARDS